MVKSRGLTIIVLRSSDGSDDCTDAASFQAGASKYFDQAPNPGRNGGFFYVGMGLGFFSAATPHTSG